jgi:hypothetical protein
VVSDDAGVLSVLQQTLTAGMDLIRVATDGKIIERRNLTTQGAGVATGLALSRKAVAYTFWRDGAIQFGIETFP